VKKLLDLGIGDQGRLDHIKNTLEKNKQLYTSDKKYLENLIKKYLDENNAYKKNDEFYLEKEPESMPTISKKEKSINTDAKLFYSDGKPQTSQIHPVRVRRQIIFSMFIPFYIFYAFAKVGKLKQGLIIIGIVYVISVGSSIALGIFDMVSDQTFESNGDNAMAYLIILIVLFTIEFLLYVLVLYYLWKWSKQWNNQFESNTNDPLKDS